MPFGGARLPLAPLGAGPESELKEMGKKQKIYTNFHSKIKERVIYECVLLPALGVSVKSVHLVAGRLGFYSQSGHTKDFKNSIRSFRARLSAQAEVRRVLCMCCSSCYVP